MTSLALLDTDTLSEIMKGKNRPIEQHATEYLRTHGRFRFSVITCYEILRGLKAKQAVRQMAIFRDKCDKSYLYPVTDEIITQASDVYAYLHQKGLLISDADIIIASTAMVHNLTLVTGNTDHFTRIPDLHCESWKSP